MFKQIKFSKIKEFITNKEQKHSNFSSETQSSKSNNQSHLIREYFTKKPYECLNIDKTLSTYRRVDLNVTVVVVVYHNKAPDDRFEFEKCIFRKFSKYYILGMNSMKIGFN